MGVLEKDWDVDAGYEAQEHRPPDGGRQLLKVFKSRYLRYLSQLAIEGISVNLPWKVLKSTRHTGMLGNSP